MRRANAIPLQRHAHYRYDGATVSEANEILLKHAALIRNLCERLRVRRLEVFGSATTDEFDPSRSDFDFLFELADPRSPDLARRYFALLDGLQAILGREVDLVDLTAIENPYFLRKVNTQRRVLYAA